MMELSYTEENYIKAIFTLSQGKKRVSTSHIAGALKTQPSSVTDMIRKLSEKGLVDYVKYQGVNLTPSGRKSAITVIRKSRIWEVFLVEKLGFAWDEVHPIAEQLEHIHSEPLIDRLDAYLDFPAVDPHGDPIPDKEGNISNRKQVLLSSLKPGERGTLTGVKDSTPVFLNYLDQLEIALGTELTVARVETYDGSMTLLRSGSRVVISQQTAQNLSIKKLPIC
jgi:DtxR family Mn-dependent transcriptional regulator